MKRIGKSSSPFNIEQGTMHWLHAAIFDDRDESQFIAYLAVAQQRKMESMRVYFPCRPYSRGNLSQVIFTSLPVWKMAGGSTNSYNAGTQDCPKCFARLSFVHENFHATQVVKLSAKELGTMSENNTRGITSGVFKSYMGDEQSYPSSFLELA